jgi:hypothetical protein
MAPVTAAQASKQIQTAETNINREVEEFGRAAAAAGIKNPFTKGGIQNYSNNELQKIVENAQKQAGGSLGDLSEPFAQSIKELARTGFELAQAKQAAKEGDFEGVAGIVDIIDINLKSENQYGINLKNPSFINPSAVEQKYNYLRNEVEKRVKGNVDVKTDGRGNITTGNAKGNYGVQLAINADQQLDQAGAALKGFKPGTEEGTLAALKAYKFLGLAEGLLTTPQR